MKTLQNILDLFESCDSEEEANTLLLAKFEMGSVPAALMLEYLAVTQGDVAKCLKTAIND